MHLHFHIFISCHHCYKTLPSPCLSVHATCVLPLSYHESNAGLSSPISYNIYIFFFFLSWILHYNTCSSSAFMDTAVESSSSSPSWCSHSNFLPFLLMIAGCPPSFPFPSWMQNYHLPPFFPHGWNIITCLRSSPHGCSVTTGLHSWMQCYYLPPFLYAASPAAPLVLWPLCCGEALPSSRHHRSNVAIVTLCRLFRGITSRHCVLKRSLITFLESIVLALVGSFSC